MSPNCTFNCPLPTWGSPGGVSLSGHGERSRLQLLLKLVQVAMRAPPGCTIFGCPSLGVPAYFRAFCIHLVHLVRNSLSVLGRNEQARPAHPSTGRDCPHGPVVGCAGAGPHLHMQCAFLRWELCEISETVFQIGDQGFAVGYFVLSM